MRLREQYKHLLNYGANLITLLVEGVCFGYIWYSVYEEQFGFWRRGNWAVVGLYVLVIFFFTKVFGGYNIGYMRMTDIALSHILSILLSGIVGYLELCLICRDYVEPAPMLGVMAVETVFILPWIYIIRKFYAKLYPPRQMLVIYGHYAPDELISKINTRRDKYNICGSVSYEIGHEKLYPMIREYNAVVLCDLPAQARNQIMKFCYQESIRTYVTPKISDIIFRGADDIHLFDTPLLLCRNYGLTFEQKLGKRIFDLVFAVVFLVILSPVMLASAIAIKLDDGGPVLFKQKRLTYHGKEFYVYKFRSMVVDAEKSGPQLAKENDSRITKVGRILRKCRLDELPQLINILRGDMSVVGPRPERPELAEEYEKTMPEFEFRLQVKAGLTGYAQVTGLYDTLPYDKLKMDLMYIENYSIFMDLRIILMTLKTALFPGETNEEANAHDAQELLYQEEQIQEQEKEKGDHS